MNAIVFVVMPARESQPLAEQAAARPVIDLLPPAASSPRISEPDQTTPPFWTWFIQNPRPIGFSPAR
jgi:hypothetical protein